MMVSIPGGFSCSLRSHVDRQWPIGLAIVSIPGGFSCSLRSISQCRMACNDINVSIPGGFSWLVAITVVTAAMCIGTHRFQSLAGFLARCDHDRQDVASMAIAWFQSLAGFLARCDVHDELLRCRSDIDVSIPGGFSWLVATASLIICRRSSGVSIPGGFSCSLRCQIATICQRLHEFQSLAGFLARCDFGIDA